jgi:predicted urease superfamily metal-dependent hydrolase
VLHSHLNRHWLYALAAIVLLLQSFAVWHDAEHPFHTAEAQCERLNAINHLPAADITPELAVFVHSTPVEVTELHSRSVLANRPNLQQAIRAPPVFL